MDYQEGRDLLLYRAGLISRPLSSQLGEREPNATEKLAIKMLVEAGEIKPLAVAYPVIGADISRWQGQIDWGKMASKVYFVIIQSTYGSSGIDTYYERNLAEAHKHGRAVGIYHYLKPDRDAKKTARLFYDAWKDSGSHLLPSFDLEETGGLDKSALNGWMEKVLKNFAELAGKDPFGQGYSSKGFMDSNVMTKPTFDWPKWLDWWVASWTTAAQPALPAWMILINNPRSWDYWQFTSKGDGAAYGAQSRSLDLNRSKLSLGAFNQKHKLKLQPIDDEPAQPPPPPPVGTFQMTVTATRGLNIRNGPGLGYPDIGDLPYGSTVNVLNVGGSDAWIEIAPNKWVCVQQGQYRYLESA